MNITILIGRLTRDPYSIRDGVKLTLAVDRPPAQDGTVKTDFQLLRYLVIRLTTARGF